MSVDTIYFLENLCTYLLYLYVLFFGYKQFFFFEKSGINIYMYYVLFFFLINTMYYSIPFNIFF